jgi:quercetin dioxygenase-like cupin family protein
MVQADTRPAAVRFGPPAKRLEYARVDRGALVADPTATDPDKYKVIFENERVRVLEYRDEPGQRTSPHDHPDSVMYTLSSFDRRLARGAGEGRDLRLEAGEVRWLDAQTHSGENIGDSPTHVLFVELKEPPARAGEAVLGPSS